MTQTFRVYDSDFTDRQSPELINTAAAVALSYNGNWQAMIDWKRHCQEARPLDHSEARTILNMALSDSTQSSWHGAIRAQIAWRRNAPPPVQIERHLQVVPETSSTRWFVDTHVKIHGMFRPEGWNAKVHLVDQHRSFLRWEVPGNHRTRTIDTPKVPAELYLYGWCGKHYKNPNIIAITDDAPNYEIVHEEQMCRGCLRQHKTEQIPPSGRINFRGHTFARFWKDLS